MAAARNLAELHLDAFFEDLELSSDALAAIKSEGKNLQKLFVYVDKWNVEEMNKQMRIFHDTHVRCFVIDEKKPRSVCDSREPLVCWMK